MLLPAQILFVVVVHIASLIVCTFAISQQSGLGNDIPAIEELKNFYPLNHIPESLKKSIGSCNFTAAKSYDLLHPLYKEARSLKIGSFGTPFFTKVPATNGTSSNCLFVSGDYP